MRSAAESRVRQSAKSTRRGWDTQVRIRRRAPKPPPHRHAQRGLTRAFSAPFGNGEGNQKIGYHYAIEQGFDFVALLHWDGQYAAELLPSLVEPLRTGEADAVFGSRMIKPRDALKGGMPLYKFVGNRILTVAQNWMLGTRLSEFHSGYRVYAVDALKSIPFERNANAVHFDTEIIIQLVTAGRTIKELAIPTYYGDEICYVNGLRYAKAVIKASLQGWFQKIHLFYDRRFDCEPIAEGRRYPSKLEFESSHSRVVALIPERSSILDLGSGIGAVGAALKEKNCHVIGCDVQQGSTHGLLRPLLPG